MIITIELTPPGVKSEPLFKSDAEYQAWREKFIIDVARANEGRPQSIRFPAIHVPPQLRWW